MSAFADDSVRDPASVVQTLSLVELRRLGLPPAVELWLVCEAMKVPSEPPVAGVRLDPLDAALIEVDEQGRPSRVPGAPGPSSFAPEALLGEAQDVDRALVYSAGILLFELIAGANPFAGMDAESIVMAHLSRRVPTPLPRAPVDLTKSLVPLALSAMSLDVGRRPANLEALLQAISAAIAPLRPEVRRGMDPKAARVVVHTALVRRAGVHSTNPPDNAELPDHIDVALDSQRPTAPPTAPPHGRRRWILAVLVATLLIATPLVAVVMRAPRPKLLVAQTLRPGVTWTDRTAERASVMASATSGSSASADPSSTTQTAPGGDDPSARPGAGEVPLLRPSASVTPPRRNESPRRPPGLYDPLGI